MRAWPLILLLAAGCSAAARMETPTNDTSPSEGLTDPTREVHIHIDTGTHRLGAYQLVIKYDSKVARIASIRECDASTFGVTPQFWGETFATGATRVFASTLAGRKPDNFHLLTVTFERVAAGTSSIEVVLEKFTDDAKEPKSFTPTYTVRPDKIEFPK